MRNINIEYYYLYYIALFENVSYLQFKYTIMFTKDTRSQVSVDTNDRHLGQCIGRLTVDSRDLTKLRRRRQWERLCTCITLFCKFLCRLWTTTKWNDQILSWLENGKGMAINFAFSLWTGTQSPLFSSNRGITAKKLQRTRRRRCRIVRSVAWSTLDQLTTNNGK